MLLQRVKNRISTKLLLINLIGIITATALLTIFSSAMIHSVFKKRYEDKLLIPERIFLAQYTYKDILPYIDGLKERSNFAAESLQYYNDRQYVLDIEKTHSDKEYPSEYHSAKERMEEYAQALSEFQDEKYHTIKKRLLELRVGAGLANLHIFADIGVPDMYIHIFDAVYQGEPAGEFSEDFGTPNPKLFFTDAEQIFITGEPVIVLSNNNHDHHDKSYYSLVPIKDENGSVIAIIGTDINMQSLENQLDSFVLHSVTIIIFVSLVLVCVMYFTICRLVVRPIKKLTAISRDIASGNVYGEIPAWIMGRKDEMGILGQSYASMSRVLLELLGKSDALFEAAMSGRLDTRSNPASVAGFFAQLANKINDTLGVIVSYLDSIPGPVAILNSEFDIVFTNKQFKKTFTGVDDSEIYKTLLGAEDDVVRGSLKEQLAEHLEHEDISTLGWFDISGEQRCLSFLCRRVTRDGNTNGAIVVMTDSTELVTAKDRALSANKAKSEFLSRVSHEFRTPLNVILGMAKLGMGDKRLEDSSERFGKIVASSSHLADLINDVLDMSRMESGKTEIKQEPMILKKTAEECIELLTLRAQENGIALKSSIDPHLPAVLVGDEFRIKQILLNLLSNAIKFTARGHVALDIAVTERDEGSCVVQFTVADTGIGMSKDFLNKVFTPFEQEDSFLSRRYTGSGLGLSISKNLVTHMGGDITVESKLGEGSRFSFNIPFNIAKLAQDGENGDIAGDFEISLEGKRILLVDDIDINRMIVSEIFSDTGVEIEEACDGEEALKKFKKSPEEYFDCVLMDIQMPKMDGYTATGAIRACGRADNDIPIIAMTANALKEDIEDARAAGMNDHIAKPIDFIMCMKKVKKWCSCGRGCGREIRSQRAGFSEQGLDTGAQESGEGAFLVTAQEVPVRVAF